MADVRVGIVSWNTAALLDRCLAALPGALGALDAEVVVVDNASTDGSVAVARRAGIELIENEHNVGYARAMDQALAGTAAPFLVALNPDTEAPPGSLAALVERLRAQPGVALVAPQLRNEDGSLQHSVHRFPTASVALAFLVPAALRRRLLGRRLWLEGSAPHDEAADVDWVIGAVHAIRAEALGGDEPYSTRWFMYAEDIELCWRLRGRGWRVRLEPSIAVTHAGNAAGAQAWGSDRARRYWAATYDFVERSRGRPAARRLAVANVAAVGVQWAAARLTGRAAVAADLRHVAPVHVDYARTGRVNRALAGVDPAAP